MGEYFWGIRTKKVSRKAATKMHKICIEEGGNGFTEINVAEGRTPGVNSGRYQGWFSGPNRGAPFDQELAMRVDSRIRREVA